MNPVTTTTTEQYIIVQSPYDETFNARARRISGRFDRPGVTPGRAWSFDIRDETRVRDLCRAVYGTDGSDTGPELTVRMPVHPGNGAECRFAGMRLVWRQARDYPVRVADGVVLISGGFPGSGGSMKYPDILPKAGTVIEVRDLPAGMARLMVDQVDGAEIVDPADKQRAVLLAERVKLATRLDEIDALLAAPGPDPAAPTA